MVSQFLDASELKLGPLTFKHQVQKIEIQEVKSVRPIDTVRSNRYFISDSGEARHVAQIRLLFTGLNEINAGIEGGTDDTSGIRGLIALFKACPITTIQNKELGTCWNYIDDEFVADLKNQEAAALQKNLGTTSSFFNNESISKAIAKAPNTKIDRIRNLYSKYIPCSIDSLHVENVPEIPYSLQVTIVVSRTDVTPYFKKSRSFGSLLYQGQNIGEQTPNPSNAFWLKSWMNQLLDNGTIRLLEKSDFDYLTLTKYSLEYPDIGNEPGGEEIKIPITTNPEHIKGGIVLAESCSLSNKFSYKKLSGHGWCCPTHMGSTSRSMSLDLVFNNQESSEDFELFCKFKESSDKLVKLKELDRLLRVEGWLLKSPVSKLLNTVRLTSKNARIGSNHTAFVPLSIDFDTSDIPNMMNCRVNLIENNPDIFSQSEAIIGSSGVENRELREYFDKVVTRQAKYRKDGFPIINDNEDEFRLFWPVGPTGVTVQNKVTSSLLNKDTLRAALLSDFRIRKLLKGEVLVSGRIKSTEKITGYQQLTTNLSTFVASIFGKDAPAAFVETAGQVVEDYFGEYLTFNEEENPTATLGQRAAAAGTKDRLAQLIWAALLGNIEGSPFSVSDTSTATQKIIDILLKNKTANPSDKFFDALYKVITERRPVPSYLSNAYSNTGVFDAFYILLLSQQSDAETVRPGDIAKDPNLLDILKQEVVNRNLTFGSESLFPDLILPTYGELYGQRWKEFAPTFGDLGQSVPLPVHELEPAVNQNNYVSPAAWFFIERQKNKLRDASKEIKEAVNSAKGRLHVSIPFNTDEIKKLNEYFKKGDNAGLSKEKLEKFLNETITKEDNLKFRKEKTVSEIINNGLKRWKNQNRSTYNATLIDIAANHDNAINPENPVKLYFHHNGNSALIKQSDIPGLGGHIYTALNRLAQKLELDNQEDFGADEDESLSSVKERDINWHRNLAKNNDTAVDSSISQVHDDFYSAEKMFPTFKIYLIDKRGDEVVGDSTLFSINAVKSIDITLDKHDAPLAVIRIADPLFILQNDVFAEGNIDSVTKDGETTEIVRASLPSDQRTRTDFYKRYKIAQGRPVQIRLGYSSVPSALPIVFTGRITEIQHGDELLIVAQGWKAELFNRQISFYNDKSKSWGPRDLVIQAITEANPDGIGTNYTPDKTKIIGKAIESTLAAAMVERVQANQRNSGVGGSRSVSQQLGDYLGSFIGLNESEGLKGLDFRLKNIWYPDTKLYSNIFGLRSFFGIMPTGVNDSWVIPIQPAWYAIEEATRHTWNTVAEVVPYDTEATLFMGHPDQPYYYTEGSKYLNRLNGHYDKVFKKDFLKQVEKAFNDFLNSEYYLFNSEASPKLRTIYSQRVTGGGFSVNTIESQFIENNLASLKSFITSIKYLKEFPRISLRDPTVYPTYVQAKNKLGANKLASHLFRRFFRVSRDTMTSWPSAEGDLDFALQHNGPISEVADFRVQEALEAIGSEDVGEDLVGKAVKELERFKDLLSVKDRYTTRTRSRYRPLLNTLKIDLVTKALQTYDVGLQGYIDEIQWPLEELIGTLDTLGYRDYYPPADVSQRILRLVTDLEKALSKTISKLDNIRPDFLGDAETGGNFYLLWLDNEKISKLSVEEQWPYFKAFVYYFSTFVNNTTNPEQQNRIQSILGTKFPTPNMRVFRVHHYLNSDLNIISNKMTATTNEMWNTVVIEHPERGEVDSIVDDANIVNTGKINASANWKYWPSQEVTGVKGLQFHPGIVLSNKKVKVFTELNCQSQDLAAKLACNRLAEGIRKMYRGNICSIGKYIKPHDRIILADDYAKMSGVVGVESVIHHFNAEDGWVTNIKPEAVCDSNPSAAVMQTAALEATYESVFNVIDFTSEVLTWAAIIATAGAATPLAVGRSSVTKGALSVVKGLFNPKRLLANTVKRQKQNASEALKILRDKKDYKGLLNKISGLYKSFGGTAESYFLGQLALASGKFGADVGFKSHVIAGFAEDYSPGGKGVEQLPVIINPVLHNGTPLTAGLEMGDHMWQVGAVGTYYSFRSMREALINFSEEIISELEE